MDKQEILNTMASVSAIAENEEERLEDFLPLRSYMALGDPNRFLVLGGRGSGKTRLFKTLLNDAGFAQIVGGQRQLFRPNTDNTRFLAGDDLTESRFPSPSANFHKNSRKNSLLQTPKFFHFPEKTVPAK